MFSRIMIGVDGGAGGRDAIALARKLLCGDGAFVLAHVYSGDPRIHRVARGEYDSAARARSLALLERARQDAQIEAEIRCVEAGSVGRGLHELAEGEGADLLVVGSERRSALGRVLIGDDTRGALDGAPCAVAVAPAGYRRKPCPIREIVVGYDRSPQSEHALDRARELAGDLDGTLSVLEVVQIPAMDVASGALLTDDLIDELVGDAYERVSGLEGVEPHVSYGKVAEELALFSASLDLLIVGSRGLGAVGRLIHGSTSRRLAGAARCPLLVVPRGDRGAADATRDSGVAAAAG